MAKPYAHLASIDTYALRDLPESGMGYYILRGRLGQEQYDRTLVIAGDKVVPASDHPSLFTIDDLWRREPFPHEERRGVDLAGLQASTATFALPTGYIGSPGAVPLLGTLTLTAPTKFFRFIMAASDHRFSSGTLVKDTYLTTELDRQFVNSGFGAVGRYALPIPVPACYVFEYTLPSGTILDVGTVLPNYGQAGGGVEVRTKAAVATTQNSLPKLPEC